jgi:hypothetical protein
MLKRLFYFLLGEPDKDSMMDQLFNGVKSSNKRSHLSDKKKYSPDTYMYELCQFKENYLSKIEALLEEVSTDDEKHYNRDRYFICKFFPKSVFLEKYSTLISVLENGNHLSEQLLSNLKGIKALTSSQTYNGYFYKNLKKYLVESKKPELKEIASPYINEMNDIEEKAYAYMRELPRWYENADAVFKMLVNLVSAIEDVTNLLDKEYDFNFKSLELKKSNRPYLEGLSDRSISSFKLKNINTLNTISDRRKFAETLFSDTDYVFIDSQDLTTEESPFLALKKLVADLVVIFDMLLIKNAPDNISNLISSSIYTAYADAPYAEIILQYYNHNGYPLPSVFQGKISSQKSQYYSNRHLSSHFLDASLPFILGKTRKETFFPRPWYQKIDNLTDHEILSTREYF